MSVSFASLPPQPQRMWEGEAQDFSAMAKDFIRDSDIPLRGIKKVEVKRYYNGWEVMCGKLQPRWTPHVEVKYWPEEIMAIGKIMSFTIKSKIEGLSSSHFAQLIVDELKKYIQEGLEEDSILSPDEVSSVFQDALAYLKHVHRYNDDESEYGMLVARSKLPPNQTFKKTSLVFYYTAIGMYACCACACVPVVDKS